MEQSITGKYFFKYVVIFFQEEQKKYLMIVPKEWNISTHSRFSDQIRNEIKTLLFLASIHQTKKREPNIMECGIWNLPRDIIFEISKFVPYCE